MTSRTFDLAVVGAGVIGLAHAYTAAKAGLRVAVIERDTRADGASIRNSGVVTLTGQQRGEVWQLARRTLDVWAELGRAGVVRIEQQGLCLLARSPEAVAVIEAFLATEMGEGCGRMRPEAFRIWTGLGGANLRAVLHSPHELRVEPRLAIPALTAWLEQALGVVFFNETVAFEVAPPIVRTSRGTIEAGRVVVCPGDDFATLYPERIAAYGLRRCRLSMLKLVDPGFRAPVTLMSDLSLTRYRGYAELPEAVALEARLRAEHPDCYDHGVHLIAAQGADGGLIVGDSHHYGQPPAPFAPAAAERAILEEYSRALDREAPPVEERWTGTYAVSGERAFLVDAPEPGVRLVMITNGAGASIGFGLAERVVGDLFGLGSQNVA